MFYPQHRQPGPITAKKVNIFAGVWSTLNAQTAFLRETKEVNLAVSAVLRMGQHNGRTRKCTVCTGETVVH